MEEFKSLFKDSLPIKNPQGTWVNARNILLTKGFDSVANEDGFKFSYLVSGVVIGTIVTNFDIVFFSKNNDGTDEIGVVNTQSETLEYKTVVKSDLLGFNYNCPIEGIFIYNFKKELIVSWCHGVKINSQIPQILNVTTPALDLNPDGSLVDPNEIVKLGLFPTILEGDITYEYLETGSIEAYSMYITYAYLFNDSTTTAFFATSTLVYLGEGYDPVDRKGVKVTISELDSNYNKLKVGIVLVTDGGLEAYESTAIDYTGNNVVTNITDLNQYSSIEADEIVLEQIVFTKIQSMTKQDDRVVVGNVEINDELKIQKYANLLEVEPFGYIPANKQEPSYLPDEVYALFIRGQRLDGTYTDAAHIPGRRSFGGERDPLTQQQKDDYNLNWVDDNFKQFHFFNNGQIPLEEENQNFGQRMGYWENLETYPDIDEFNSSVDYDGTLLTQANGLTGEDLRNKNIRYHRMPSLEYINQFFTDYTPKGKNLDQEDFFHIGLRVKNFDSVFPDNIKNQLQGYQLLFVKRDSTNSYVAGNWLMTRRRRLEVPFDFGRQFWEPFNFEIADNDTNHPAITNPNHEDPGGSLAGNMHFNRGRVLGAELYQFRPAYDLTFFKANYLLDISDNSFVASIDNNHKFAKTINNLVYKPENNIDAETEYGETAINIEVDPDTLQEIDNGFGELGLRYLPLPFVSGGFNAEKFKLPNITAFTFKENLYTGFSFSNFIVAGRTNDINSDSVDFYGGDVFTSSKIDAYLTSIRTRSTTGIGQRVYDFISIHMDVKGLYSPLNYYSIENEGITNLTLQITVQVSNDGASQERFGAIADLAVKDYVLDAIGENTLSEVNDLNTILSIDYENKFITRFPYRLYRGLKIANENLTDSSLRIFLSDAYYEQPNDKGEIIAVRGKQDALFIQHRFSLFLAQLKDTLKTGDVDAFLGQADLFYRAPKELKSDDRGYIGTTSKFACVIIQGIYIVIDQVNGKVFFIKENINEISKIGLRNHLHSNADIGLGYYELDIDNNKIRIDNPYCSVGYSIGYDKINNRILVTKRNFKIKNTTVFDNFDGEFYRRNGEILPFSVANFDNISETLSISLDTTAFVCNHDYYANMYLFFGKRLFSFYNTFENLNTEIVEHNDETNKGYYYNQKFESSIDLVFNRDITKTKLLKALKWITTSRNTEGGNEYFNTFTHIVIYNEHQCSGKIPLTELENIRNIEGEWRFNDFRDIVIDKNSPIIDNGGKLVEENLDYSKLWFDKSNFIGKFIVVRLIHDNINNDTIYLHSCNTISTINTK